MARVDFVEVSKRYGEQVAVDRANLAVRDHELLVLLGPSGCGKSTLLKMVAGLEDISGGEISIGGKVVNYLPPGDRDVAMVFQNYALYPHMTIYDNIAFPLKMSKLPKPEIDRRVNDAARILGLDPYLQRKPEKLSGGQRQRVALGRAIVREPSVFLMDEPLSNLDAQLRVQTREELIKLHARLQTTMIYVTHDQIEAMTMGHRVVVMRGGVIQQVGAPREVYDHPVNTFVAAFLGSPRINLQRGNLIARGDALLFAADGAEIPLSPRLATLARQYGALNEVALGVRPEDIVVLTEGVSSDSAQPLLPAVVDLVEPTGADLFVNATTGALLWTARTPPRLPVERGSRVTLRLDLDHAHLFDADGRNLTTSA